MNKFNTRASGYREENTEGRTQKKNDLKRTMVASVWLIAAGNVNYIIATEDRQQREVDNDVVHNSNDKWYLILLKEVQKKYPNISP